MIKTCRLIGVKNCRHGEVRYQNTEKNVDVFYGWSLSSSRSYDIGCGFTEDAPAFSAQINSSFFHTIMTIVFKWSSYYISMKYVV